MIPALKGTVVAPSCGPTEPRVLSVSLCGRKVLCGALCTDVTAARQAKELVKHRLVSALLQRHCDLAGNRNPGEMSRSFALRKNRLGKPLLAVDELKELSISFTHVPGTCWAALCHGAQVGIDASEFREFEGSYPFHRAFHEGEGLCAIADAVGSVQEAAALMWSAKEAAVKAVGSGFHLIDPIEVKVRTIVVDARNASSEVRLERNIDEQTLNGPDVITVRSFRYSNGWISVASA